MRTVVIGLGNPILGDDGVGWRIAEQVASDARDLGVDVECLATGGLDLMEHLVGYDLAVIIDAMATGQSAPGTVGVFPLAALPEHGAGHTASAHDTSVQAALRLAQTMGAKVPDDIWVVTVESTNVFDFTEVLSPPVAAAVPRAAAVVRELLETHHQEEARHGIT